MSRIHEALRQAEKERNSSGEAAAKAVTLETGATTSASGIGPRVPYGADRRSVAISAESLRFEDVLAARSAENWKADHGSNVFDKTSAPDNAAEQFRTLRSRLYKFREKQSLRTVLVTSPLPAEGKTFVASNLAQSLIRQQEHKTLLIDMDLRRPSLHSALGAPVGLGLADYLRGQTDDLSILHRGEKANLWFVPAGFNSSDACELLSGGSLKRFLERMTHIFDWILIDSPPCVPVADAALVSPLCDGIVMVVRAASTPSLSAQKACRELGEKKIVGVVLNRAAPPNIYYEGYEYRSVKSE
jgi:protein-tyrosine kinase